MTPGPQPPRGAPRGEKVTVENQLVLQASSFKLQLLIIDQDDEIRGTDTLS